MSDKTLRMAMPQAVSLAALVPAMVTYPGNMASIWITRAVLSQPGVAAGLGVSQNLDALRTLPFGSGAPNASDVYGIPSDPVGRAVRAIHDTLYDTASTAGSGRLTLAASQIIDQALSSQIALAPPVEADHRGWTSLASDGLFTQEYWNHVIGDARLYRTAAAILRLYPNRAAASLLDSDTGQRNLVRDVLAAALLDTDPEETFGQLVAIMLRGHTYGPLTGPLERALEENRGWLTTLVSFASRLPYVVRVPLLTFVMTLLSKPTAGGNATQDVSGVSVQALNLVLLQGDAPTTATQGRRTGQVTSPLRALVGESGLTGRERGNAITESGALVNTLNTSDVSGYAALIMAAYYGCLSVSPSTFPANALSLNADKRALGIMGLIDMVYNDMVQVQRRDDAGPVTVADFYDSMLRHSLVIEALYQAIVTLGIIDAKQFRLLSLYEVTELARTFAARGIPADTLARIDAWDVARRVIEPPLWLDPVFWMAGDASLYVDCGKDCQSTNMPDPGQRTGAQGSSQSARPHPTADQPGNRYASPPPQFAAPFRVPEVAAPSRGPEFAGPPRVPERVPARVVPGSSETIGRGFAPPSAPVAPPMPIDEDILGINEAPVAPAAPAARGGGAASLGDAREAAGGMLGRTVRFTEAR